MLISHEVPLALLDSSRSFNDYDFALVHLFEKHKQYFDFFVDSLKTGREVLLDNSVFELNTAFEASRYAFWIETLKPQYYIIPDSLEDKEQTISNCEHWLSTYNGLPGTPVGVVQGKTYKDIVECYKYLDSKVGKIAISFDYSLYKTLVPHPNKCISWMLGRIVLLGMLVRDGIINKSKSHHLLGASNPREFSFYREGYEWLESVDTSSPVVHGLLNIRYGEFGLWEKKSIKLVDLINYPENKINFECVDYNIRKFREFVSE